MGAWTYVAPRLRASTGNALIDPLHRASGAGEPGRRLLDGARGGAGAHRRRGARAPPSAGERASAKTGAGPRGMTTTRMRGSLRRRSRSLLAAPRLLASRRSAAQSRWARRVAGLGVTARVLMIGAHPDDEDTQLITWLARGRHVETAYLSLTRGDGGQNLIGNELGEALGVIRTEELLAARRIDGGAAVLHARVRLRLLARRAEETYTHWPKDSILRDVVTVVRAFRPHVIVAVFTGTPRDGHGHHQVSGILAREAYDAAGGHRALPARATLGLGAWTPLKFYRGAAVQPAGRDALDQRRRVRARCSGDRTPRSRRRAGRSTSRRGSARCSGAARRLDYVKLEASHVSPPIVRETVDVRDARHGVGAVHRRDAASAARVRRWTRSPDAVAAVRRVESLVAPAPMVAPLARVRPTARRGARASCHARGTDWPSDARASTAISRSRSRRRSAARSGAARGRGCAGRGDGAARARRRGRYAPGHGDRLQPGQAARSGSTGASAWTHGRRGAAARRDDRRRSRRTAAGASRSRSRRRAPACPWWMARPRVGDMFTLPPRVDEQASNSRSARIACSTRMRRPRW